MNRGAFAAIIKNEAVLLVKSRTHERFKDHWSFPGGLVEPGESIKAGAKREAIEETGIVCDIGALLCEVENAEDDIKVSIFKATYESGELEIDEKEITDAQWFAVIDALELPLAFNTKSILRTLQRVKS